MGAYTCEIYISNQGMQQVEIINLKKLDNNDKKEGRRRIGKLLEFSSCATPGTRLSDVIKSTDHHQTSGQQQRGEGKIKMKTENGKRV